MSRRRDSSISIGAENLPPVFPAEIVGRDKDGELLAKPLEWTRGEPPLIRLMLGRRDKRQPGVGERALVKIERLSRSGPTLEVHARVLTILDARATRIIGVFRPEGAGGRILPIDKKSLGRELHVRPDDTLDAQDGDLVAVETIREEKLGLKRAKVVERLGSATGEKAASMIAIHNHAIPHVFPDAALEEAEAAKPAVMKGREDWRELSLITIDPADAKDHDDAVHAMPDDDPANAGGFILSIAIADVAAYVRPGGALDREAADRGNSVYFPDRVVPMLPERISNDLCSLVPGKDRPALAVRVVIAADGRKLAHSFHRIMMQSHAKLAYEQAQAAVDGTIPLSDLILSPSKDDRPSDNHEQSTLRQAQGEGFVQAVLRPLYGAYAALKRARTDRAPLDLDLPERKLILDADGKVKDVTLRDRLDAHRLIEEMMILANVCAAETLIEKKSLLLFRIHDAPAMAKMETLRTFLRTLEADLPKGGTVRPSLFNRIIGQFTDTAHATLVNEVILRSQAQAEYAPENIGHFGLNLRRYAHFTSPIRRYADLIVHRALVRALELGEDGLPDMTLDRLRELGSQISGAERRAMAAERETYDRLIAHHLADQIGARFAGRVSGVTKSGLFVKLDKTGADGFVPAATLGADFYRHDEAAQALVGDRTGDGWRLGDNVEVRLAEATPLAGALRFEILTEGSRIGAVSGKRGERRRRVMRENPLKAVKGRRTRGR
ncbi:MAG: ribonuclease R family protein [Beijerinckiaceae bacterium]